MASELRRRIGERRRIYILRHGDVTYFDGAGMPHRPDGVALNPRGIAQAEAARDALKGIPIDRIVDSGLPRTRRTAEIVGEGLGIPVESRGEFREVAPGRFLAAEAGANPERSFLSALGGPLTRESQFLGGETFGSLQDRVLSGLGALLADPRWKHIVIVGHGGTNRIILLHALGAGLERLGSIEQEPGCINIVDLDPSGDLLVRLVNYTPYAPLKEDIWATTMEKIFLEREDALQPPAPRPEAG